MIALLKDMGMRKVVYKFILLGQKIDEFFRNTDVRPFVRRCLHAVWGKMSKKIITQKGDASKAVAQQFVISFSLKMRHEIKKALTYQKSLLRVGCETNLHFRLDRGKE